MPTVPAAYSAHRHEGERQPAPVRRGVTQKASELVHSVNRYFTSTQSATTPSRQVIFFPSSYPRPS